MTDRWLRMLKRLVCALKGHRFKRETIAAKQYCTLFMDVCERCGDGQRDVEIARIEYAQFERQR